MSAYTHNGKCSTSEPCRRCFEFGQTTEQARIIKLLEGIEHISNCCFQPNCCKTAGDLIALIKGEK